MGTTPAAKPIDPRLNGIIRAVMKLYTRLNVFVYRTSSGRLMNRFPNGSPICLVTMTGARSGRRRTIPLIYIPNGEDVVLVASQGGMSTHPLWFYNIRANPRGLHHRAGTHAPHAGPHRRRRRESSRVARRRRRVPGLCRIPGAYHARHSGVRLQPLLKLRERAAPASKHPWHTAARKAYPRPRPPFCRHPAARAAQALPRKRPAARVARSRHRH